MANDIHHFAFVLRFEDTSNFQVEVLDDFTSYLITYLRTVIYLVIARDSGVLPKRRDPDLIARLSVALNDVWFVPTTHGIS